MTNELQLLFIQTWMDFGSRALFVVTLMLCLGDVKFLAGNSYSDQSSIESQDREPTRESEPSH